MVSSQNIGQSALMASARVDIASEHTKPGSRVPGTSPRCNLQSPATGFETNFDDSGFYDGDDDRTDPHRHPYDYEDFVLFDDCEIPVLGLDSFFADLDASTKSNQRSVFDGVDNDNTSYIERGAVLDTESKDSHRTSLYDPVHEAAQLSISQAVYEAINDFDTRSQPDYSRPSQHPHLLSPVEKWASTYERHESIAYRLEQPSNAPSPLSQTRQASQPSGQRSRSRYH